MYGATSLKLASCTFGLNKLFKPRTYFTLPVPKRLEEVVKLPLFKRESPEKLQQLWFEQFSNNPSVAVDVIRQAEWSLIKQNVIHSPQFVIPIFKDSKPSSIIGGSRRPLSETVPTSYFNLFLQFQDCRLGLMSSLESFKLNPSGSPPFAILSFFDDLVESKGLVFVRCDAVAKEHLEKRDLMFCLDYVRAFYSDATLYKECVEKFNHRSRDFDFHAFMGKTGPIRLQIYQGSQISPAVKGPEEFRFE